MFKKTKFLDPFPLLHGLWLVAISDGKLDPSELEFLKQVVSGLQQATGKSGKLAEFGNFDSVIDHLSSFTEEEHMRHINSTSYFEERPNRQVAFELFSKLAMVDGALEDHEVVAMMRVLIEIGADGEEFAYPGGEKFLVDKELLHEMEQELGALVIAAATSIFGLVAMADGQITPEELRSFTEAVRRELNFDISQEQAQGLFIAFLENDEESHMDRIRKASDFPEFQRQILFQFAREAAEAHSETDQNESRYLREISEALGLDLLSEGEGEAVSKDRMEVSPGMCVPQADSSEMIILARASFSACFLVAASDGEISGDEIRTFMHELQERYDLETEEDDVVETFRDALGLDLEDHLHRIAEAVSLPEHIRREIIQVALAVAASDGNIAIDEILCLPDIAAALDIELSGEEQDEDEGEEAEVESDTPTGAIDEPQGIPFGLYDGIIAQVRADQPDRKDFEDGLRLPAEKSDIKFEPVGELLEQVGMKPAVRLIPGRDEIVALDDKGTLFFFDTCTGAKLQEFHRDSTDAYTPNIEVSPDGQYLVCFNSYNSEPAEVWSIADRSRKGGLSRIRPDLPTTRQLIEDVNDDVADDETVEAAIFDPTSKYIYTGTADGSVFKWSVEDLSCVYAFGGLLATVEHLALSADGSKLGIAGGPWEQSVIVLDTTNGSRLQELSLSAGVQTLLFHPLTGSLITGSTDGKTKPFQVWNIATGQMEDSFGKSPGSPGSNAIAVFSEDGRRILTNRSGSMRIWDSSSLEMQCELECEDLVRIQGACFGARGSIIFGVCADDWSGQSIGTGRVWDAASGTEMAVLEIMSSDSIMSGFAAFNESGDRLVVAVSTSGSEKRAPLKLWRVSGSVLMRLLQDTMSGFSANLEGIELANEGVAAYRAGDFDKAMQLYSEAAASDLEFDPAEQATLVKLAEVLDVDLSDLGGGLSLKQVNDEEEPEGSSIADQEEEYDPETNPVLVAALHGDADKVRSLLSQGHSATDIHQSGTDALILAVREGHLDIVELLLDAGADANRMNPASGMTPLRIAVQQQRISIAEFLLKKGADPDLCDEASGIGPLTVLVSVANRFEDDGALHLLNLLVSAGARQRPLGLEEMTLPLIAFAATQSGLPPGFLRRLAEGADRKDLDLALWSACIEGEEVNVQELLAAGADVNMTVPPLEHDPSAVGDSPINAATTRGHTECVRQLIAAGADVNRNAPAEGGQFPLLMAAENGRSEIVTMLLDAGAEVSMVNPENGTHPLGGAIRNGHGDIVRMLLAAGADANIESAGYGGPQITFAAYDGKFEIVHLLIAHGADVNMEGSEQGNTALILAASQGYLDIVELLLKSGADPAHISTVHGKTALDAARLGGHGEVQRALVAAIGNASATSSTSGGLGRRLQRVFGKVS